MELKKGALVAVVDGASLKLFSNTGDAGALKLSEQSAGDVSTDNKGSGGRHASSSANGVDPHAYIADVIAKVAGDWLASRWDELMPWKWMQPADQPIAQAA